MDNEECKFNSSFEKVSRSSFKNPLGSDAEQSDSDDWMNVDIEPETDSCNEDFAEASKTDEDGKFKRVHDSALRRSNKIKTLPTNAMQHPISNSYFE